MTSMAHAPSTPIPFGVSCACKRAATARNAGAVRRLLNILRLWRRRAQESRQLLSLPDTALRDIGISRSDAWREARKPFWRA